MAYGFKSRLSHQNYVPDFAVGHIFIVFRKPLARRVVQKKPGGDDVDRKTPFAIE